jgi:hypothetical protein
MVREASKLFRWQSPFEHEGDWRWINQRSTKAGRAFDYPLSGSSNAPSIEAGHLFAQSLSCSLLLLAVALLRVRPGCDPAILLRQADENLANASDHGFTFWVAAALSFRGSSLLALGRVQEALKDISDGLAKLQATGALTIHPVVSHLVSPSSWGSWSTNRWARTTGRGRASNRSNTGTLD